MSNTMDRQMIVARLRECMGSDFHEGSLSVGKNSQDREMIRASILRGNYDEGYVLVEFISVGDTPGDCVRRIEGAVTALRNAGP